MTSPDGLVTARRRPGEEAVFAFAPRAGSEHVALLCSPDEYQAVIERGWASLDGITGRPVLPDCDPDAGFLRLRLDEPWQPPTRLKAAA